MHVGHSINTRCCMKEIETRVEVQSVKEEKDLEVFFTYNLKPSEQCLNAAVKADRKSVV